MVNTVFYFVSSQGVITVDCDKTDNSYQLADVYGQNARDWPCITCFCTWSLHKSLAIRFFKSLHRTDDKFYVRIYAGPSLETVSNLK